MLNLGYNQWFRLSAVVFLYCHWLIRGQLYVFLMFVAYFLMYVYNLRPPPERQKGGDA